MPIDEDEWGELGDKLPPAIAQPFYELYEAHPQALSSQELMEGGKSGRSDRGNEEIIADGMAMVRRDVFVQVLAYHGFVDCKQADDGTVYYRLRSDIPVEEVTRLLTDEGESETLLNWIEDQTQD